MFLKRSLYIKDLCLVSFNVRGLISGPHKFRPEISRLIASNDLNTLVETYLKHDESVTDLASMEICERLVQASAGCGSSVFNKSSFTVNVVRNQSSNVWCARVTGTDFQDILLLFAVYFPPKNFSLLVTEEDYCGIMESYLSSVLPGKPLFFVGVSMHV